MRKGKERTDEGEREFVDWLGKLDFSMDITRAERAAREFRLPFERVLELYREYAETIDFQDFIRVHGQDLIVGVPVGFISSMRNNFDLVDDLRNFNDIDFEGFLKRILKRKFMLSASSVTNHAEAHKFYHPTGIILKSGKIYDASHRDLAAISQNGVRLRSTAGSDSFENLDKRADVAARVAEDNSHDYNEFIVGDYAPRGLFVNLDAIRHVAWSDGKFSVPRYKLDEKDTRLVLVGLKAVSSEYGLPVFGFRKGFGFSEIDPAKV